MLARHIAGDEFDVLAKQQLEDDTERHKGQTDLRKLHNPLPYTIKNFHAGNLHQTFKDQSAVTSIIYGNNATLSYNQTNNSILKYPSGKHAQAGGTAKPSKPSHDLLAHGDSGGSCRRRRVWSRAR